MIFYIQKKIESAGSSSTIAAIVATKKMQILQTIACTGVIVILPTCFFRFCSKNSRNQRVKALMRGGFRSHCKKRPENLLSCHQGDHLEGARVHDCVASAWAAVRAGTR